MSENIEIRKNMDEKSFELVKLIIKGNPKIKRAKLVEMVGFSESTIRRAIKCADWEEYELAKAEIRKKASAKRGNRKQQEQQEMLIADEHHEVDNEPLASMSGDLKAIRQMLEWIVEALK